ncbi:MAG: hypothetical protein HQM08_15365 [Candidatus Riflebacteria bacterium]|nr:hypothetical protein [Candidatus Riflebacteria bacterium]
MAKIYKSFQIKVDPKQVAKVSISPAPPKLHPKPAPLPGAAAQATTPGPTPPGSNEAAPASTPASAAPPVFAPAPAAPPLFSTVSEAQTNADSQSSLNNLISARATAALANANRKAGELAALETQLKGWEAELKKKAQEVEEEGKKQHQDYLQRRKALDEESAKIIDTAKKAAENLISSSQAEAGTIKKSIQVEYEDTKKKAYKEGYALGEEKGVQEGEKQGLHEGKLEWQGLIQETEALINELQTSRMGILKSSQEEMLKLVISFAKRVIKVEVKAQPEVILQNIDEAINKISSVDKIVLKINLRDKSLAEERKQDFLSRLSGVSELTIVEDSSLSPGGVKIETGVGTVDATIETQAEELEKALIKALNLPDDENPPPA